MTPAILVFVTVSSAREADKLSKALVGEKLAACVSTAPAVKSRYWWEGKMETASERLLIIKSRRSKLTALTRRIRALHSYSVPEVIALPILGGNPDYLRWIDRSLGKKR
jgi:periplasmic divalent cation tolerance protein